MKNFFTLPQEPQCSGGPELFKTLLTGPAGLRVERIVSWGQTTPPGDWYDQDGDEWVMVAAGEAGLAFEDGPEIRLSQGDQLFLPARRKHRVTYTSRPCLWLAVHGRDLKEPEGD